MNPGSYGYPYALITASLAHSAMLRSLRHGSLLAVIVAAIWVTVLRRMLGQSPVSFASFFQAASCFCIWGYAGYLKNYGRNTLFPWVAYMCLHWSMTLFINDWPLLHTLIR